MSASKKPSRPRLGRAAGIVRFRGWWQLVLALLVVTGSLAASSLIIRRAANAVTFTPAKLQDCRQKGDNSFTCYGKYYAQLTFDAGTDAAFADMQKAYEADPTVKSQCHQLAHIVGRTAYEKYGSLEESYRRGNNFCWSGFYHGAIEQAATDLGQAKIRQAAPTICQDFANKQKYSFDHFNCVHGLGHGLMAVNNYQLPDALENCDALEDNWEQSSCYGGVFMESVMVAARGDGSGQWFKPDQPLYPCTLVKTRYKEQCYLMQSSYVLQHNGYDFAKTFQECAKADTGFDTTCYRSVGRDASGSTVSDVAGTINNCSKAQNQNALYNCMIGAERDFVSYYHGTAKAEELCQAFGRLNGVLTEPCKADVAEYYKAF